MEYKLLIYYHPDGISVKSNSKLPPQNKLPYGFRRTSDHSMIVWHEWVKTLTNTPIDRLQLSGGHTLTILTHLP